MPQKKNYAHKKIIALCKGPCGLTRLVLAKHRKCTSCWFKERRAAGKWKGNAAYERKRRARLKAAHPFCISCGSKKHTIVTRSGLCRVCAWERVPCIFAGCSAKADKALEKPLCPRHLSSFLRESGSRNPYRASLRFGSHLSPEKRKAAQEALDAVILDSMVSPDPDPRGENYFSY